MIGKNELIKRLAIKKYGTANNVGIYELQQTAQFCDALADVFEEALSENEKIMWSGFLIAEVVEKPERRGRHPKTGEVVVFPPSKSIHFKLSPKIKDAVKRNWRNDETLQD